MSHSFSTSVYLESKRLEKYVKELEERDTDDFWSDTVPLVIRARSLINRKTDDGGGKVTMSFGDFKQRNTFMGQS